MTMLAYRPETAAALAAGASAPEISDDKREELRRLHGQITSLAVPLASVQSLASAEKISTSLLPEYSRLAILWSRVLPPDAVQLTNESESPLSETARASGLLSDAAMEQLYGVLESSSAFFRWLSRNANASLDQEHEQRVAAIVEAVRDRVAQAELAFIAIGLTIGKEPGSTPEAIPVLVELADRLWTEVEDVFLGLAEYGEDGGTVPLSEVRAELGL